MAQHDGASGGQVYCEIERCREGLGWTTACSSMPKRDRKNQEEDSPKQACQCRFSCHSQLTKSGASLYPPDVFWFADAILPFSAATSVFSYLIIVLDTNLRRLIVQSLFDTELGRNPVKVSTRFSLTEYGDEQAGAGRDCRNRLARPNSMSQTRGQGNINFPCLADHEQNWQPYPVDPYSCYMCDHTYSHAPRQSHEVS